LIKITAGKQTATRPHEDQAKSTTMVSKDKTNRAYGICPRHSKAHRSRRIWRRERDLTNIRGMKFFVSLREVRKDGRKVAVSTC